MGNKADGDSATKGHGIDFGMTLLAFVRLDLAPTEKQITSFQAYLEDSIVEHLKGKPWCYGNPNLGSVLRCFGTDWRPDLTLQRALDRSGISSYLGLPVKRLMWVDPDGVRIRVDGRRVLIEDVK